MNMYNILKKSCYIQFFNAFMDLIVFFIFNYYVPSWSLALVMLFNAIIIWFLCHNIEKYLSK